MKNNRLDDYIKNQINTKEIKVSESAWNRLESRMDFMNEQKTEQNKKAKNVWWMSAAAILLIGVVGGFLFMNQSNEVEQTELVNYQPKEIKAEKTVIHTNDTTNSTNNSDKNRVDLKEEVENPKAFVSNEKVILKEEKAVSEKVHQKIVPTETIKEVKVIDVPEIKTPKTLVKNDSVNKSKKKNTNYVDPDMLLYSIENKENIKQTNDNNNRLVIYDFNR